MGLGLLTRDMTIPLKKLLALTIIFSSSFAWFFAFYTSYDDIFSIFTTEALWLNIGSALFLISIVISAFLGSTIANRVERRKLLFSWIIIGLLILLSMPLFQGIAPLVLFSILTGVSFGFGFPSCMALIADFTDPEERGRVSGFLILITFLLVFASLYFNSIVGFQGSIYGPSQPVGLIFVTVAIKSMGLLSFMFDKLKRSRVESKSWRSIFGCRDFTLYTVAYIIFNVAAGLVAFIWLGLPTDDPDYLSFKRLGDAIRYLGLGIFGVAAGIAADRIGRKKPIILGLVMLGAGYALIGLVTNPATYLVNLVLSGFAWGIIMVLYLIIPGDLAFHGSEDRSYAAGWILPLILYISVNRIPNLLELIFDIGIFSTILSILIFMSIIPIWSSAETLAESKMRKRRFKEYTEKVGKVAQETRETS